MFADFTLTVDSLVEVMEKVTSDERRRREVWGEVLVWHYYPRNPLHIPLPTKMLKPPAYLDEVYTNYTTDKEKTHTLADVYINIRPESSWQHLLQTLYAGGELAAAKEAKSLLRIQQNGG